jgi:hypothetical protein
LGGRDSDGLVRGEHERLTSPRELQRCVAFECRESGRFVRGRIDQDVRAPNPHRGGARADLKLFRLSPTANQNPSPSFRKLDVHASVSEISLLHDKFRIPIQVSHTLRSKNDGGFSISSLDHLPGPEFLTLPFEGLPVHEHVSFNEGQKR